MSVPRRLRKVRHFSFVVGSLPLWVKVALAGGLLVSIGLAFFGRGPAQPASRRVVLAVAGGGVIGYLVGLHAALSGRTAFAAALIAVAVETMCLAVWLAKARSDGEGGTPHGGGEDPGGPGDDSPLDWDAFDRARREWRPPGPREREREPV